MRNAGQLLIQWWGQRTSLRNIARWKIGNSHILLHLPWQIKGDLSYVKSLYAEKNKISRFFRSSRWTRLYVRWRKALYLCFCVCAWSEKGVYDDGRWDIRDKAKRKVRSMHMNRVHAIGEIMWRSQRHGKKKSMLLLEWLLLLLCALARACVRACVRVIVCVYVL